MESVQQKDEIIAWAEKTKTGDKSDLPFSPSDRLWANFAVGSDECKGKDCKCIKKCFSQAARKSLSESHVVVLNYHLLYSDLVVRLKTEGKSRVLPEFHYLILDEAHEAGDIAKQCFGFEVTELSCKYAVHRLPYDSKDIPTRAPMGLARSEAGGCCRSLPASVHG
jgi:ATP-dependent DNA helicase DinG